MSGRVHTVAACAGPFGERYRLLGNQLGAGTHGSIHEAECGLTGRRVAVKKYDKAALNDRERRRVQTEVDHLAALSHSGVVQFEGWYEEPEAIYVVLEKLGGGSLHSWLEENFSDSCPEAEVAAVAWQLLHALDHLHRQGVAHRDVKLENVMFESKERRVVKLVDFGFSRKMDSDEAQTLQDRCGSLQYVAPEVLSGQPYDERCDLFSLGSVLYALLTSEELFYGDDRAEIRQKNSRGEVDWSARFFYLSKETQEFVQWLLTVDPNQRPSAAQALQHPWLQSHRSSGVMGEDFEDAVATCQRCQSRQSMHGVCRSLTRNFSSATHFARDVLAEAGTFVEVDTASPWHKMHDLFGRCSVATADWRAVVPRWAADLHRPFA